jgi:hypothetical protein
MRKPEIRQRMGRRQDSNNEDDGASEPADSIIDSDSEGEEDSEVDGMLGE